jgi:hypothetical protein
MQNIPPNTDDTRLRHLIDAIVENRAAEDELRELETLLQASAEHRSAYRRVMGVHADLSWLHRAESDTSDQRATSPGAAPLPAPIDLPAADHPLTGDTGATGAGNHIAFFLPIIRLVHRVGAMRLAAAAVVLGLSAALGVAHLYHSMMPSEDAQRPAIAVAELRSDHDCQWADLESPIAIGTAINSGQRLKLLQGTAKLVFKNGATVLVESPAEFEVLTSNSLHLQRGTVAVRAGDDKDFTVASPDASIVDLGTSFGVHCSERGITEVEVFEGAVEVYPDGKSKNSRVLGIGASAKVQQDSRKPRVDMVASAVDRFGNLLELLWEDLSNDRDDETRGDDNPTIVADFTDGPVPGAIDTFYGAIRGRGWRTPWVAAGNPIGEIIDHESLAGEGNPYLRLRFGQAYDRAVARQYGERPDFNPNKPHVISWLWRFDGNLEDFGNQFDDRIYFFGNSFFRRNTWPTNTWLIGVVGGDDNQPPTRSNLSSRKVFPKRWFAFDGHKGKYGNEFDRRNMVDSGMELKQGVVYRFAIVVYPAEKKYDVAIRDDQQTFMRTGLSFRNRSGEAGHVVHFGAYSDRSTDDFRFSLDSVRIEPLKEGWLQEGFSQSPVETASGDGDEHESVAAAKPSDAGS